MVLIGFDKMISSGWLQPIFGIILNFKHLKDPIPKVGRIGREHLHHLPQLFIPNPTNLLPKSSFPFPYAKPGHSHQL